MEKREKKALVNADEQGRPNPSLGTYGEIDKALSQMRSGLRHFYFDRIFFCTAKLTSKLWSAPKHPDHLPIIQFSEVNMSQE